MIDFFRKIRIKIADDNKPIKPAADRWNSFLKVNPFYHRHQYLLLNAFQERLAFF